MTGTMTDLSWPDEPGTWVGEDGTVYDVVISLEADEVRAGWGVLRIVQL